MSPEHREVNRRLRILEHAKESGNVCLTCRYFGIGRATFYRWKKKYDENGEGGLVPGKPIGKRWPNQLSDEVVELVKERNLDGELKTIIGRAPVSSDHAQEIGADAHAFDCLSAVERVKSLLDIS